MEISEKKKFMPAITNYLSDNDNEENCDSVDNPQPVQKNYAEWKRLQKESPNATNVSNGVRLVRKHLGDISSCEDDPKFDDNDPIFKIMNCLSEKEAFRRRNEALRRKNKTPSHFLLFCRMKQLKHFNCSFSDLCQISQASWDNMQPSENEELMGNIDLRMRDYKEVLSKFRTMLLPDSTGRIKYKSWVSAAVASKQETPAILPTPTVVSTLPPKIPERLQNLAGDASVYNAPEKPKSTDRHSFKYYKASKGYQSDTSLNYVVAISANDNCNFPDCENKPVEDYRWDGQYCSAKCLIKDCSMTFHGWLTDRSQSMANGDTAALNTDNDDEIMLYLESPSPSPSLSPESDDSISRTEDLFASLRKKNRSSENAVLEQAKGRQHQPSMPQPAADVDAPSKLHSLVNRSTRTCTLESFHSKAKRRIIYD